MAYAAITCLMNTVQQSMEVTGYDLQSFYEKLESWRANLEKSSHRTSGDQLEELTRVEAEIIELACSSEDMVDAESRKDGITRLEFLLKQQVECIDSAMNKWMIIAEKNMYMTKNKDNIIANTSSSQHALLEPDENMNMVGDENEFEMMQGKLTRGKELKVVSIVGMGGIGKTTLANKIYSDPFIMSHFDIRGKVTVSQEYCRENVLLGLLSSRSGKSSHELYEQQDDGELAEQLQKLLKGRRYLVVIDDIWTTEAWDDIQLCFPDCNNGSRILMTTRNMDVAKFASSGNTTPYQMSLLDFKRSWNLLHTKVFDKESCVSHEFKEIGKQIALKCGGLPLAITVIAGVLSKIGKSLGEWQSVAENVSSVVSTDVDVQCMQALSYHHLPHHLKQCFLYFAIFPADEVIFVDKLMELWVVEGFLKAEDTKSVEQVAEKCLNDLIDRSLISIHNLSFDKKLDSCQMHDVTRELCLREARNVNFVNVIREENNQNPYPQSMCFSSKSRGWVSIQLINMPDDRVIEEKWSRYPNTVVSSIICFRMLWSMPKLLCFKLLRVLDLALVKCDAFPNGIIDLIHLRYLALSLSPGVERYLGEGIPSSIDIPLSISSLCYLQTLILNLPHSKGYQQWEKKYPLILPSEILTMMQLRYLLLDWNYFQFHEPTEKRLVLRNLQCLSGWNPWYCTKFVFRLFPNLRKLQICGVKEDYCSCTDPYDFRDLDQLEELEFHLYYSFLPVCPFFLRSTPSDYLRFTERERPSWTLPTVCYFQPLVLPPVDAFPQNLKKLAFSMTFLRWKDMSIVGQLPKLEALKLEYRACIGEEWEVVEKGFPCLKFLCLEDLNLEYWKASGDHFPCLERLFLEECRFLDSIPRDFADITTLALIDIRRCAESVGSSAKHIQQDIEENYAGSIEVHIRDPKGGDDLKMPYEPN
ncbi:hypothetical protein KY289_012876 [Solanum tuberosum]|nr:hypothetical protein KY289_012876 [Solanum tuberosum]